MALALVIIAGVVTLALLFKPFFGDKDHFFECVRFWFTPDLFSLFRGEYHQDWWAEMKLGAWLFLGGIVGFLVYTGVGNLLIASSRCD